jgi:hypothetical protein
MKKVKLYENREVTAYNAEDLNTKNEIINRAISIWHDKCKEFEIVNGDMGTCVLGAGIEVYFLYPRCRKPKQFMIISASQVTGCQGSIVWEKSVEEVVKFLKENGIEAQYNCGYMD